MIHCRVEAEHNRVKQALSRKQCTFDTVFTAANRIMEIQIIEIKASMEQSKTRHAVRRRDRVLFSQIIGRVSRKALEIISAELIRGRVSDIGTDPEACGCYYRRTHGIPCAHELNLTIENGGPILLSDIHEFWKKLDLNLSDADPTIPTEEDFTQLFEEIVNTPLPLRKSLFRTIKESLNPLEVDISAPPHGPEGSQPRKSISTRILSGFEHTAKFFGASCETGKGSRCSFIASSQGSPASGVSSGTFF